MNPTLAAGDALLAGRRAPVDVLRDAHSHGICWRAVLAGAAGAASLSLILLMLGVGLGLSSVSPWYGDGLSAEAFGVSTILWLGFTQFAASAMGGYLAGRLRTRWMGVQADEVYFRDTAHGFLAWSVAALVTAGLLGSAVGAILGTGAKAGVAVAGTAATAAMGAAPAAANGNGAAGGMSYFVDAMFRRDLGASASAAAAGTAPASATGNPPGAAASPVTDEALRIVASAAASGSLPPEDVRYLGRLVARQTGMSPADAERRVSEIFTRLQAKADAAQQEARAAADKARKAAATASLWGFIALLMGAFIASWMATVGGRHRDQI